MILRSLKISQPLGLQLKLRGEEKQSSMNDHIQRVTDNLRSAGDGSCRVTDPLARAVPLKLFWRASCSIQSLAGHSSCPRRREVLLVKVQRVQLHQHPSTMPPQQLQLRKVLQVKETQLLGQWVCSRRLTYAFSMSLSLTLYQRSPETTTSFSQLAHLPVHHRLLCIGCYLRQVSDSTNSGEVVWSCISHT
jgi:hypothetical protein